MATKQPMLLSILVNGFKADDLELLFAQIFGQSKISRFEVVLYVEKDEDVWEMGNRYTHLFPDRISLIHSQEQLDHNDVLRRLLQVASGRYYTLIQPGQRFDAEVMAAAVVGLEGDFLFSHPLVQRAWNVPHHIKPYSPLDHKETPLVSICVYNYNYGRYLDQCLNSIFDQTYPNIEVCFSDNASSDESWQIAQAFSQRYAQRGDKVTLIRNRENFGPGTNISNCLNFARGKYIMALCSDDALKPEFVERCVTLLEKNPDAGFAMTHRDVLDGAGNITTEPPFYDRSCVIPGEEQAAVYMMAAVSLTHSQILYRRERWMGAAPPAAFTHRWFANRLWDFCVCLNYSMVYIKDALILHREHAASDSSEIDRTLIQGMGQYALVLQFSEIAASHGMDKPVARTADAIAKVGRICLRFCTRFLMRDDEATAVRYLHLAQAIFPAIVEDSDFSLLKDYFNRDPAGKQELLAELIKDSTITTRQVSYAPPVNSMAC